MKFLFKQCAMLTVRKWHLVIQQQVSFTVSWTLTIEQHRRHDESKGGFCMCSLHSFSLAALGLRCCRLSLVAMGGRVGSCSSLPCAAFSSRGFCWCRAWALGAWASAAVAHGLSCPEARGVFLDQGLSRASCHGRQTPHPWTAKEALCCPFRVWM